jgi:hypothetical protein
VRAVERPAMAHDYANPAVIVTLAPALPRGPSLAARPFRSDARRALRMCHRLRLPLLRPASPSARRTAVRCASPHRRLRSSRARSNIECGADGRSVNGGHRRENRPRVTNGDLNARN